MINQYDVLKELVLPNQIKNIITDSRYIEEGDIFIALKGQSTDGNLYITQAINRGAKFVITDNRDIKHDKIIYVDDIALALEQLINILYPKQPSNIIAVTGTNGKTSVVSYVRQLLEKLDKKVASIGTLGLECYCVDNSKIDIRGYNINTPDIATMHRLLHQLANQGVDYLVFEASSHGINQQRIKNVRINLAAFTSFSQDHLDYHNTMENYLQAKLQLFTDYLIRDGSIVVNADMFNFNYIKDYLVSHGKNISSVGINADNDNLKIIDIQYNDYQQVVHFLYQQKNYEIITNILGCFQVNNLLIAVLLVHKLSINLEKILTYIPTIKAPKGRLEKLETSININKAVFIDYAHTPDSLMLSLKELRKLINNGRLIVLFGCGGERDKAKRPIMGAIAEQLADIVIITDDNPRHEDAKQIRQDIIRDSKKALEIPDRKQAILYAITLMQEKDILLIAGKGHENYQIIGSQKIYMNDAEIAHNILNQQ